MATDQANDGAEQRVGGECADARVVFDLLDKLIGLLLRTFNGEFIHGDVFLFFYRQNPLAEKRFHLFVAERFQRGGAECCAQWRCVVADDARADQNAVVRIVR